MLKINAKIDKAKIDGDLKKTKKRFTTIIKKSV